MDSLYCDECGNDCYRQLDHDPRCMYHPSHHMPFCDRCGSDDLPRYYSARSKRNMCGSCLTELYGVTLP